MAQPLTASMPEGLDLPGAWTLRVTALDATTGAVVPGVEIGTVSITAENVLGGSLEADGFVANPLLVKVQV